MALIIYALLGAAVVGLSVFIMDVHAASGGSGAVAFKVPYFPLAALGLLLSLLLIAIVVLTAVLRTLTGGVSKPYWLRFGAYYLGSGVASIAAGPERILAAMVPYL
ncbi:MAG: hypothetical protein AAF092_06370 [Pseudomonadota bacterium]